MEQIYFPLLLTALAAILVIAPMLIIPRILGPRKPSPVKSEPFECGSELITLAGGMVSIKFYPYALLFLIFDLEIVFLFPLAVIFRKFLQIPRLGMVVFLGLLIYLGIAAAGLVYAWQRGALEWES